MRDTPRRRSTKCTQSLEIQNDILPTLWAYVYCLDKPSVGLLPALSHSVQGGDQMTFDPTQNRPEIDISPAAVERLANLLMATPDRHYQGHGQTAAFKMRALRAALDAVEARAVGVPAVVARGVVRDTTDPTGRTMYVLFDRAMSDDEMRDWHDQINALHPASPLGAVMEVPEVRSLVEAAKGLRVRYDIMGCGDGLEALALDAALAPFARKGE